MSEGLELSPEVESALSEQDLARLHEARERTELRCSVCQGSVGPESEERVTVSLLFDPNTTTMAIHIAHRACAPSRTDMGDLPAQVVEGPGRITYVRFLRADLGAVLVWERNLNVRQRHSGGQEVQPYLEGYRATGFRPWHVGEALQILGDWRLRLEGSGSDLVLYRRGEETDRFENCAAKPPPGWFDALHDRNSCLLAVGSELWLERPDVEHINAAITTGDALVALVAFEAPRT
jgi:hypothetical protein